MSGLWKNTASQKWRVFAFDYSAMVPKTGDANNITAQIDIDHAGEGAVADTNPTEIGSGYYEFDLSAGETNGDCLELRPSSSTGNVVVTPCPAVIYTRPKHASGLPAVSFATSAWQAVGRAFARGANLIVVTKAGNDTTGDGTAALPYLTLAKALTVAASGDTIYLGPGTYSEANDGSALDNIEITGPGATITSTNTTATLQGGHGWYVHDIAIANTGVSATSGQCVALRFLWTHGTRVERCQLTGNTGVWIQGVRNSYVRGCRVVGKEYGIYVTAASEDEGERSWIMDNNVQIAGWATCNAIGIHCNSTHQVVERNQVYATAATDNATFAVTGIAALARVGGILRSNVTRVISVGATHAYGYAIHQGPSGATDIVLLLDCCTHVTAEGTGNAYDVYAHGGLGYVSGVLGNTGAFGGIGTISEVGYDLIDALNSTAVAAIQGGLATGAALDNAHDNLAGMLVEVDASADELLNRLSVERTALIDEIATVAAQSGIIRKINQNKCSWNTATGVLTVYDDDGTTPLYTATFTTPDGGVPTSRTSGHLNRTAFA